MVASRQEFQQNPYPMEQTHLPTTNNKNNNNQTRLKKNLRKTDDHRPCDLMVVFHIRARINHHSSGAGWTPRTGLSACGLPNLEGKCFSIHPLPHHHAVCDCSSFISFEIMFHTHMESREKAIDLTIALPMAILSTFSQTIPLHSILLK